MDDVILRAKLTDTFLRMTKTKDSHLHGVVNNFGALMQNNELNKFYRTDTFSLTRRVLNRQVLVFFLAENRRAEQLLSLNCLCLISMVDHKNSRKNMCGQARRIMACACSFCRYFDSCFPTSHDIAPLRGVTAPVILLACSKLNQVAVSQ